MSHKAHASRITRGFTIVELLIVIVVIAILAAISIAAYTGIQDRANSSSAQAAARQAATKLQVAFAETGDYPGSLLAVGVSDSGSTTFQYRVDNATNPKLFCVTATTNNKSYYISNTQSTPASGGCAGHSQGGTAAITNLVRNPSLRIDTSQWWPAASVTRVADATATSGFAVEKATSQYQLYTAVAGFPSEETTAVYGIDIWIPADEAASSANMRLWAEHITNPYTQWATQPITVTKTKQRFYTVVTSAAGQTSANIGIRDAAGVRIRASAMLVAVTSGQPSFYDGDSPSWMWNGAPNNSTSTGPAL